MKLDKQWFIDTFIESFFGTLFAALLLGLLSQPLLAIGNPDLFVLLALVVCLVGVAAGKFFMVAMFRGVERVNPFKYNDE